jgi:DNA polymerase I-like protein with 3'-5' exonuclease and polymerase domains
MSFERFIIQPSWVNRVTERISNADIVGIDLETYPKPSFKNHSKGGLDPYLSEIRSITLAIAGYSFFIDLQKIRDIEPLLKAFRDRKITYVSHNQRFEVSHLLNKYDTFFERGFCTFLASQMLTPVYTYAKHSLEACVDKWLGIKLDKTSQKSDWSGELSQEQIDYAFTDAEILLPLYDKFHGLLDRAGMMKAAQIEFDCILAIADMELTGVCRDLDMIKELDAVLNTRINILKEYLQYEFPKSLLGKQQRSFLLDDPINIDSPLQLKKAFKEKTGISLEIPDEYDNSGKKKKKPGLSSVIVKHRHLYPKLIDAIIDYGSLSHMKASFAEPLLSDEHIHPVSGRIHPDYMQLGQQTGRCAMKNPNFNFPAPYKFGPAVKASDPIFGPNYYYPKSFRNTIIPQEGNLYSIVDFANSQLRIIADTPFANEKALQEEFALSTGADPYSRIGAIGMTLRDGREWTKQEIKASGIRQKYKTLTLALAFICSAKRFQSQQLDDTRIEPPLDQCEQEIANFYQALPGMKKWQRDFPPIVREQGYVRTKAGRKIFIPPEYCTANRAVNFGVVGTECDGAKLALGRFSRELRKKNYASRPVLFLYDEIIADTPSSEIDDIRILQEKIMLDSMQEQLVDVPAGVDGHMGDSWASK